MKKMKTLWPCNKVNQAKLKGAESKLPQARQVRILIHLTYFIAKTQKEADLKTKQGSSFRHGRWTKEEHLRFLEALKLFGKEWRRVQQHVGTRTST